MDEHAETAALVMSELATNAVKVAGLPVSDAEPWQIKEEHVIGVQLRAIGTGLHVEVWDRSEAAPVRRCPSPDTEGGRGLVLVDRLCASWDVYRPWVGGKIVSAELPLNSTVDDSRTTTEPGSEAYASRAVRLRARRRWLCSIGY
jgi:anti-sigma regulatory factor (Ser/Thr protein kinase)